MPTTRLNDLLAHAAPAAVAKPRHEMSMPVARMSPTTPTPSPPSALRRSSQPDRESLVAAARLILNAVSETVLSQTSPVPPAVDPATTVVSLPELLRTFLSDRERTILRTVAGAPKGAVKASWVQSQTGIEKSTFWPLWSQLQVRGLVVQTGAGRSPAYSLGPEWLRALVLN